MANDQEFLGSGEGQALPLQRVVELVGKYRTPLLAAVALLAVFFVYSNFLAPGSISVSVVERDGGPVDADVQLLQGGRVVRSLAVSGETVTFSGLLPGEYSVEVQPVESRLLAGFRSVPLSAGQAASARAELSRAFERDVEVVGVRPSASAIGATCSPTFALAVRNTGASVVQLEAAADARLAAVFSSTAAVTVQPGEIGEIPFSIEAPARSGEVLSGQVRVRFTGRGESVSWTVGEAPRLNIDPSSEIRCPASGDCRPAVKLSNSGRAPLTQITLSVLGQLAGVVQFIDEAGSPTTGPVVIDVLEPGSDRVVNLDVPAAAAGRVGNLRIESPCPPKTRELRITR